MNTSSSQILISLDQPRSDLVLRLTAEPAQNKAKNIQEI